jgi:hypothetical protein
LCKEIFETGRVLFLILLGLETLGMLLWMLLLQMSLDVVGSKTLVIMLVVCGLRTFATRSAGFFPLTTVVIFSAKALTTAAHHGVDLAGLLAAAGDLEAVKNCIMVFPRVITLCSI